MKKKYYLFNGTTVWCGNKEGWLSASEQCNPDSLNYGLALAMSIVDLEEQLYRVLKSEGVTGLANCRIDTLLTLS